MNNPMMLVHSELLFDFLVDAKPVLAECPEATGREVPATELPFVKPTSASAGIDGQRSGDATVDRLVLHLRHPARE